MSHAAEQAEKEEIKAEAADVHASEAAVRRVLLGEAEYRLAEESGYQMDTLVSMTPSRRTSTVLGPPRTWDDE